VDVSAPLDHLVYAAPHLEEVVAEAATRLGVEPSPGGHHIGLGTRNALLALGEGAYLEIIGPDHDQGDPEVPRPFGIDLLDGPRLVAWALRVADLDAAIAAARSTGIDPGDAYAMARATPNGGTLRWRLTFPTGAGPVHSVPFLIEWGDERHPARTAAAGARLVSLRGEHPDPAGLSTAVNALGASLAVTAAPEPRLVAVLEGPGGQWELR
jgi:hypothetical protein